MQNKDLNKMIIIILLAIGVVYLINSFTTRDALKEIKSDIQRTHEDLTIVNQKLGIVTISLEKSTETIKHIIKNLEKSKSILDSLSNRTGKLSGNLKKEIVKSSVFIDSVLTNIKGEAKKNKELIDNLDNTIVR